MIMNNNWDKYREILFYHYYKITTYSLKIKYYTLYIKIKI